MEIRYVLAGLISALFVSSLALAQTGSITLRAEPFLSGLAQPVLIRSSKDGTGRLFVVQQRGRILVVEPGSTTPTLFLDLTTKVSQTGSERGLLGLTFHPDFGSNGYFFVNYTRVGDNATTVARYKVSAGGATGDAVSERVLLTVAQPYSNHNGGMVEFGPDGNLYIGMGDGGSSNDPLANAQNINSLLGKMLRITPDVSGDDANPPYTVPEDNPFVGVNGADEIYAVGLRNPWRWSFDRGGSNQLWAGDVGQNAIEEVDVIERGGNYGWRVYEGNSCTGLDSSMCIPSSYNAPVFQYNRTSPRCAVTGGYVYRGKRKTFPNGAYLYADYCTGEVMMWFGGSQTVVLDTPRLISSFGEDDEGEIYVVGLGSTTLATGTIDKLVRPARKKIGAVGDDRQAARPKSIDRDIAGVAADLDGDGITDTGSFDIVTGSWVWSTAGGRKDFSFGRPGDVPSAYDVDGDRKADLVLYRPLENLWYVLRSSDRAVAVYSTSPIPSRQ